MPQPPKPLEPGRSNRDWFGAELRHWRDKRRMTQDQLGAFVHVSGDLIAKIEKADRPCTAELAAALDAELETGGVLLRALVRVTAEADSRAPDADGRTSEADSHSAEADNLATGRRKGGPAPESVSIPALSGRALPSLCPPGLSADAAGHGEARVPCRTADGRIIFVTMPRRAFLRGGAAGAALLASAVPSAAATAHPASSGAFVPDTHPVQHLRQLRRALVECDNLLGPGRVLDTVLDHIQLIRRLRGDATGPDRHALLHVQAEYAEFCGWLCQDAGDHRAAQYWMDRALSWSHAAGGQELITYVMVRKAQLAGDMRDPAETVDLAEAAQRLAPPHSRLRAMGAMYGAYGHALRGDSAACGHAYDTALDHLVSGERDDSPVRRGGWLDATYIQAQRARSLSALGDHRGAVEGFGQAIRALPPTYRRDRGVYLTRSAVAHARLGEPERAAATGMEALPVAAQTGSARILGELAVLDADLRRWPTVPEVIEFREALDGIVTHQT